MRRLVVALALVLAPAAGAVGPSPPAVDGVAVGPYVTSLAAGATTLRVRGGGELRLAGRWGVPLVAYGSKPGGLSADGRVLVLSDNTTPSAEVRAHSRFVVVDTRTLRVRQTIALAGDYSFDALSPHAATLYLIHHLAGTDVTRYQVRAFDLRRGRLLPGVVADRRQRSWVMRGLPVSRVTSADGRWVYTFYEQSDTYPFVHAHDTVGRSAVCIGIPANWLEQWVGGARLELANGRLRIAQRDGKVRYTVDVSKRSFPVSAGTRVG